ncbi:uncharacterized protein LOC142173332 [Nicotiana tabacum]|uniref:Uncharacterized protein LOC142173332 n=1 Tax=Nicotiana tabacum TaxID=4097 RepID=A0AC58TCQ0_TOBAC
MKRFYHVVPSKPSKSSSTPQSSSNLEETVDESEQLPQSEEVNLNRFETDRGKRLAIQKYHLNDRDAVRRAYIQQDECINRGEGDVFSSIGFTSWIKKDRFAIHISGPHNVHNQSRKKCEDLMRQKQSIQSALAKQFDQQKLEYRTRLEAAIDMIRYLLNQGLSFRGHREGESSFNRGNYIELLTWYTKRCKDIDDAY